MNMSSYELYIVSGVLWVIINWPHFFLDYTTPCSYMCDFEKILSDSQLNLLNNGLCKVCQFSPGRILSELPRGMGGK